MIRIRAAEIAGALPRGICFFWHLFPSQRWGIIDHFIETLGFYWHLFLCFRVDKSGARKKMAPYSIGHSWGGLSARWSLNPSGKSRPMNFSCELILL